jgi:hypothetical protein
MANTVNYATRFERDLMQKYARELLTSGLTTQTVRFIDAKTIKIPYITVSGYKDHSRNGGFNAGSVENDNLIFTLGFDRDIEFFVDAMDVDESNQVLTAANVTNIFVTEKAIPETDAYRISKLYADFVAPTIGNQTADTTVLSKNNILETFDTWMQQMDEDEVPEDGRIMYVTPAVSTMLKSVMTRSLASGNENLSRIITSLENVQIIKVPSGRMKTEYDFTDGFVPAVGAKQINMILVHPRSVIAVDKHSYIRLWPEGTHTKGDGWLYQNRKYGDLFLIKNRVQGVKFNVTED